jgi:hypothetical protein
MTHPERVSSPTPLNVPSAEQLESAMSVWRKSRDPADSGTPVGLIQAALAADDAVALASLPPTSTLTGWRLGPAWVAATSFTEFVRLRCPVAGKHYAFVRRTH